MNLDETYEKLYKIRRKIKLYEQQADELKESVLKHMDEINKSKIRTDRFLIERRNMTVERVSKASLPPEIWKKYAKASSHEVLNIKEISDS
jgi:hypothetical protein